MKQLMSSHPHDDDDPSCFPYVFLNGVACCVSVCQSGSSSSSSSRLAVSVDADNAGFFLKPLYDPPGKDAFALNTEEQHLVVTHPFQGGASVRAKYGPFSASQLLSPDLLQASVSNQTDASSNMILRDLDLSAHLVTRTVTTERPLLQVLFHASHLTPHDKPQADTLFCMQMHVSHDQEDLTSVCVLSGQDNVCVAELTLPPEWWLPGTTQSVDVHYSAHSVLEKRQCSSAPPLDEHAADRIVWRRSFVSSVTLTHGQLTYQELKEDQHILIYIPQKSFYPGSKFKVPVKLQAESDLKIFVTK
jgi:transmembrane protein 132